MKLKVSFGGSAPEPPEFIALWATRWAGKKGQRKAPLPIRLAACVGARVALQRCPILHTGRKIIPEMVTLGYI